MQKYDLNKVVYQNFFDKSAFLGMLTSLDDTKIKVITMVLTSVMSVILFCDWFYY